MRSTLGVYILLGILLPTVGNAQLPATPSLRGWGATEPFANCRSLPGKMHIVTTNADTGAGSFLNALNSIAPDSANFIFFTTGMRIHWDNNTGSQSFDAGFECVKIAGQTAQGGGVTLTGNQLTIDTAAVNVILSGMTFGKHRSLRFRADSSAVLFNSCFYSGSDGTGGADCINYTASTPDVANVPAGVTHIAAFNMAYECHENHPTIMQFAMGLGTGHSNFLSGPCRRLPWIVTAADSSGGAEWANNIHYNWWAGAGSTAMVQNSVTDVRQNYYQPGPATTGQPQDGRQVPIQWRAICTIAVGVCLPSFYVEENRSAESNFLPLSMDSTWRGTPAQFVCHSGSGDFTPDCAAEFDTVPLAYQRTDDLATHLGAAAPFPYQIVEFDTLALERVFATVGNSWSVNCEGDKVLRRSSLDNAAIANFRAGTGRTGPWTEAEGFIGTGIPGASPDPDAVPIVPIPTAGTACPDADSDGLPDAWETNHCGSTTCMPFDSILPSGYFAAEAYAEGFDPANADPTILETFTNGRFFYAANLIEVPFGSRTIQVPDTTIVQRGQVRAMVYKPETFDAVLAMTCEAQAGVPLDSLQVQHFINIWQPEGLSEASQLRNRNLFGVEC